MLDSAGAWLPLGLGAVEKELERASRGYGERLSDDASSTLEAGGKRLRPLLVLLCAGPDGGAEAIRSATAVELVHMATLVHDDVIDHAPLRRGRPTVAARSGRLRATATGDLLFSRAFALLAEAGDAEAIRLLSEASVSLAKGELMQRSDEYETAITEERYLQRCRLKTARLFESACLLGFGGREVGQAEIQSESGQSLDYRSADTRGQLGAFGAEIGLAFQLLDDVLDMAGPPERTGKALGTDLLDGTVTLPLILAMEADPAIARVDLRGLDTTGAAQLCRRVRSTGALEQVRDRALSMVDSAKARLEGPSFTDEQARLLSLVADGVVDRYS